MGINLKKLIFKKPKETLIKRKPVIKSKRKELIKKFFGLKFNIKKEIKKETDLLKKEKHIMDRLVHVKEKCQNLNNMHNTYKFIRTLKEEGITAKNIREYTRLYPEHIYSKLGNMDPKDKLNILSLMGFDLGYIESIKPFYLEFNPNMRGLQAQLYKKFGSNKEALKELNKFYSLRHISKGIPIREMLETFPIDTVLKEFSYEDLRNRISSADGRLQTDQGVRKFAELIYRK
jgi:DNA-binding transcriptional MerR regulator